MEGVGVDLARTFFRQGGGGSSDVDVRAP